jgi:hypothetical protein
LEEGQEEAEKRILRSVQALSYVSSKTRKREAGVTKAVFFIK